MESASLPIQEGLTARFCLRQAAFRDKVPAVTAVSETMPEQDFIASKK